VTDDPRVEELLEEPLDSVGTPEEVCGTCYARPEELERFLHEVEAVAGLRHANAVIRSLDWNPAKADNHDA
jgi:hypothetical protein